MAVHRSTEVPRTVVEVRRLAPNSSFPTRYDQQHFLTYARLLNAERAGVDWRLAAASILLCDGERDPDGSRQCWESHLARAHWVVGR